MEKKWNGKGREYDYDDKLRFEGNYLYGEKLNGREYINKKLEYEGQYLNGKNGMEKDMINLVM